MFFFLSADKFQLNLIKTLMQIEQTYFDLADMCPTNCLVICDRGVMDPSACKLVQHIHSILNKLPGCGVSESFID